MSNLNCRWASAEELARIVEPAPAPDLAMRFSVMPVVAMPAVGKPVVPKRKAVKPAVAAAMALMPMAVVAADGSSADAADGSDWPLAETGIIAADAAVEGLHPAITAPAAEPAVDEPVFSWAAMISPPRLPLIGTEKVFALMGPREGDEGEARQVDISQPANIPVQLSTPSKWRWQRLGTDIVLLGSGANQWAKLREGPLPS